MTKKELITALQPVPDDGEIVGVVPMPPYDADDPYGEYAVAEERDILRVDELVAEEGTKIVGYAIRISARKT